MARFSITLLGCSKQNCDWKIFKVSILFVRKSFIKIYLSQLCCERPAVIVRWWWWWWSPFIEGWCWCHRLWDAEELGDDGRCSSSNWNWWKDHRHWRWSHWAVKPQSTVSLPTKWHRGNCHSVSIMCRCK